MLRLMVHKAHYATAPLAHRELPAFFNLATIGNMCSYRHIFQLLFAASRVFDYFAVRLAGNHLLEQGWEIFCFSNRFDYNSVNGVTNFARTASLGHKQL